MRGFCLALLLLVGTTSAAELVPTGQLPKSAQPLHYTLHLKIDPAQDRFEGEVSISVRLTQTSDHLWLHGRGLEVHAASIQAATGAAFAVKYQQMNDEGAARISFGRKLQAQTLELRMTYSAPYNAHLEGLYRVVRDGRPYVVTQMEPTGARNAFPGFDEPAFKTPYDITLSIPEELVGIGNTRQVAEARDTAGWKTLRFATTRPLP